VEHVQVVCVNTCRLLIAVKNVAQRFFDQVLVHAREVFAIAIAMRASTWRLESPASPAEETHRFLATGITPGTDPRRVRQERDHEPKFRRPCR
jgi:hypothetical protein